MFPVIGLGQIYIIRYNILLLSGFEFIHKAVVYSDKFGFLFYLWACLVRREIIVLTEFIAGFSIPAPYIELSGTRRVTHKGDVFSVSKSGLLSVYFNGISKENDTTKTYCNSKKHCLQIIF